MWYKHFVTSNDFYLTIRKKAKGKQPRLIMVKDVTPPVTGKSFVLEAPVVILIGPTAVGKTDLALSLAEQFDGEIVGADSMQIYRYMDIGTAKPTSEEQARVAHHLIDIVDPDEDYQAARYGADALQACREITARGRMPLVVGGTGLYIRALELGVFDIEPVPETIRCRIRERLARQGRALLFEELRRIDPESAARLHPNDTQRLLRALEVFEATGVPWSAHLAAHQRTPQLKRVLKIGLNCGRDEVYARINRRCRQMLDLGLVDEVRKLLAMGYAGSLKSMQAIGYRHVLNYLAGEWSLAQTVELLARDTRRYAKRQYTWFTRDAAINWRHPGQGSEIATLIQDFLAGRPAGKENINR